MTPLNLNNVTVRYWFNCDCTSQTVQAWVDWAGLMPSGTAVTGDVQVTVHPTFLGGQTDYLLYTFTGNLVLQPGQALEVQSRFNLSDWSNMLQDNDYSYAPFTSFTDWGRVTGYLGGSLAWGQEPTSTASALTVSSALAYPNPSTGSGVNLSFTTSGGGGTTAQTIGQGEGAVPVDPSAKVTLKVFTLSGRLIWSKELSSPVYGTAGEHLSWWEERDGYGALLANGVYYYTVTLQSRGETSAATAKILILK